MTLPAENWDEDFEFDQEVNPNILGGSPHSLSSLQASSEIHSATTTTPEPTAVCSHISNPTTPHRPAATLDSSDYTQDFDFADFRESLFEKRAACGTSILETCSKEAALGFLGKIEARAAGKDEPIMDACFELVAILNISPKVRETVVAGNSLGLLVGILEDSVTDQEILSLMTLLNKVRSIKKKREKKISHVGKSIESYKNKNKQLLCEDTQTKDRLALIGIAQVFMKHGSSKSLDIRREILFFISEMATKANTICALLAARIWPLLVSQYLEMRDSRTREVAFETVCSIAKVLRGIPDKKLVADQVCVLCAGTRQEILFRKLKEILSYLFGERQQQPTRNGNIWESALYLYSLAVACTKEQADIKKILEYATKQGIYPINKTQ
ncbi:hypothetical protein BDR26DRAFT_860261 [Obelidium mucronatum]|nr:hypothetical protein BDR26DRAFT_860261 [Obelidium mucronatum]